MRPAALLYQQVADLLGNLSEGCESIPTKETDYQKNATDGGEKTWCVFVQSLTLVLLFCALTRYSLRVDKGGEHKGGLLRLRHDRCSEIN